MEPFPSPGAKLLVEKTFKAFADNLINITRYGLKIKDNSVGLLKDLQETYIKSKYRFIAKDPALFKSKYSGKENILKESDLSDGEISSLIGRKLTR